MLNKMLGFLFTVINSVSLFRITVLLVIKKDLVAIDRIVKKIVHSCEGGELGEETGLRPQNSARRAEGCEYKVDMEATG